MKTIPLACVFLAISASPLLAQESGKRSGNNDASSALTPNAPRKVTMANPVKPAWLAEPHGK